MIGVKENPASGISFFYGRWNMNNEKAPTGSAFKEFWGREFRMG